MKKGTLQVSAIQNGTVIDHIVAGQALKIIHFLNLLADEHQVTVGIHLKSRSMGRKDIIKLEGLTLTTEQAHQIAVFAPNATINIIEETQVARRFQVRIPGSLRRLFRCPNPMCVTNHETISTNFKVASVDDEISLQCLYCEKAFSQHEITTAYKI